MMKKMALFPLTPALSLRERENVENCFLIFASVQGISHLGSAPYGAGRKDF